MPAALASVVRVLLQTAVQTGIWFGLDALLLKPLKAAVQENMVENGMSEEEAKDHVANDLIDLLGIFGVTGVSIKTRIPNKVADYLGFTSKGYAKRKIISKATGGASPVILPTPVVKSTTAALTGGATSVTMETLKATKPGFKAAYDFTYKTLGVAFLGMMAIGGWVDFGNWNSGAYQKKMQDLLAFVTFGILTPDADYRTSLTVSAEVFDKVYNTYKLNGAVSFNDPFKGQSVPFTRDNMLDLVDRVGANLLKTKGEASTKQVLLATQMMMVFSDTVPTQGAGLTGQTQSSYTTPLDSGTALPKVYTGIVSQGVVGRGLVFEARPDDLIESVAELRQAAANNLTPYLQTLLGKIVYEVKIVSSYVTKEGFTKRGETQQIRNGSYTDGKPKYKTVTNKFATLIIYAITDKGARAKLSTIVLGPTNSAKLNVSQGDIATVEAELPNLVTTSDISEITGIETSNTVSVSTPPPVITNPTAAPRNSEGIPTNATKINAEDEAPEGWNVQRVGTGLYTWADDAPQSPASLQARTLSEWYASRGDKLPSLDDRSRTYEFLGLGKASYYVGSAEQNTKLLDALKSNSTTSKGTYQLEKSNTASGTELIYYPPGMKVDTSKAVKTDSSQSEATRSSSNGKTPKVKGVSVTTNEKITEYSSGGAKIGGTLFNKTEYAEFKKLRKAAGKT